MGDVLVGLGCFVVGSAVVLTFVAVIGHGLWVLIAAMFSENTSARDRRSSRRESLDKGK